MFTGDALFVGEVGRTDLLGKEVEEDLASQLFDSLHRKLIPLGPGTIIYPAHGAGSACGGSISNREESTIGLEMEQNKALRIRSKEAFVEMKMNEVMEKPFYFERMEETQSSRSAVAGSPAPYPGDDGQGIPGASRGGGDGPGLSDPHLLRRRTPPRLPQHPQGGPTELRWVDSRLRKGHPAGH